MQPNHTPGPWRVFPANSAERDVYRIIRDANLERVALIPDVQFEHQETVQADARLIAAAPELFAALQTLLTLHIAHHNMPEHAAARAAIARATGEA